MAFNGATTSYLDMVIIVAMLTGHYIVDRHADRMRLPFNDFCYVSRSTEAEELVVHYLVNAHLL